MKHSSNSLSRAHAPAISLETALSRLRRLVEQTPELRSKGRDTPLETVWRQNVEGVLTDYFGPDSWQLTQFKDIDFFPNAWNIDDPEAKFIRYFLHGVDTAEQNLKSRISELEESTQANQGPVKEVDGIKEFVSRRVFVVHGHDHGSKETLARFLSQLDLEPIILHEKPDKGRTIIEKFEDYSDVCCAVVILSADDIGYSKSNPTDKEERARQNVILELGFFVGRLGRGKTIALVVGEVARPSDINGILYIPMSGDAWRLTLVRELKAAGIDVDANKAF